MHSLTCDSAQDVSDDVSDEQDVFIPASVVDATAREACVDTDMTSALAGT